MITGKRDTINHNNINNDFLDVYCPEIVNGDNDNNSNDSSLINTGLEIKNMNIEMEMMTLEINDCYKDIWNEMKE